MLCSGIIYYLMRTIKSLAKFVKYVSGLIYLPSRIFKVSQGVPLHSFKLIGVNYPTISKVIWHNKELNIAREKITKAHPSKPWGTYKKLYWAI